MSMKECRACVLAASVVAGLQAGPVVRLSFDSEAALRVDAGSARTAFAESGRLLFDENGVKGGCAYFDGASWLEARAFPSGLKTGASPYTVSAWIRAAEDCPRAGGWVSWGAKPKGRGNSLRLHGPNAIHNYWNNRDLTVDAEGVADGRWHFVTATCDGRTRAVYMDGVLCGRDGQKPDIAAECFQVGRTMHDAAFKGWIDELTIDNRSLTDAEAFELYRAQITPAAMSRAKAEPPAPVLRATPCGAAPDTLISDGFTVRMKVDVTAIKHGETLWTMGPAKLVLRLAGADSALRDYDRTKGNYLNFCLKDGTCPVLEATICEKAGRIGIPLAFLARCDGVHDVTVQWAPPRWAICVDGTAVDEEFPVPQSPVVWKGSAEARVCSARVSVENFTSAARGRAGNEEGVRREPDARVVAKPIQYWTPADHNTWVGDVAPGFFNGRLHVFYLIDRRHHGSGAGTGRHQFAHLETDDLVHWTERPLAVPIREAWQTVGTGTPFLKDGKLAIAFGWHTSRFGDAVKGKPMGGTYAVAEDGIHFTNSGEIVSEAQNPSIYNRADGQYELVTSYGGSIGIFRSKDLKNWTLFDDKLPFRGDCPSLFDWHGHRYLLQGFHNMAYSADGTPGSFENWNDRPGKLYDGLGVPMVTSWKGDRRLYIGWLNHVHGWGGWLVFRELVQFPDGELGLKWVPEIKPPVEPISLRTTGGKTFVRRFACASGGNGLFLRIDPETRVAEFIDDRGDAVPDPAERGNNVRIGNVRELERDTEVRLVVWHDAKADATLFDAEIGGARTLICRRAGKWTLEAPKPPMTAAERASDPNRPQLRFTQGYGWANDPNGLVWRNGEWHFFHQHNPYGVNWGNMTWNHATSKDLIHWTEQGDALFPDKFGTMFSGSAVVDTANTAGFGAGAQVLLYTAAGSQVFPRVPYTQCLAYSTDGRTFAKYEGNPVVPCIAAGGNRDPRVFWHAPSRRWVMALYGELNKRHTVIVLNSPDLKQWTKVSEYAGDEVGKGQWLFECPGLEEVQIEGENRTAWVVWGARHEYAVGSFDGRVFTPAEERIPGVVGAPGAMPYYAAQTFTGVPDGRVVWIAWFRQTYREGARHNQSFSLPQELTLRRTEKGLRLVRRPVRELAALREGPAVPLERFEGELAEVKISCTVPKTGTVSLDLRGVPFVYDAATETLKIGKTVLPWRLTKGRLALTLFLDRVGIEVFSEDGLQMTPIADALPNPNSRRIAASTAGGVTDVDFKAWKLKSIWTP